jgi:hypothetical protein
MMRRTFALSIIGATALLLAACGGSSEQHDIAKMCNDAEALACAFGSCDSSGVQACIDDTNRQLGEVSDSVRSAADACIHCIAGSSNALCICCTTNGNLDIVSSSCGSSCDPSSMATFCAAP